MKIKQGDMVIVIAGKDKGRTGKIMKFVSSDRALIEGVNMVKKHIRPNPQKQDKGGIIDRESSVHISNLAIYNPTTNKADRVGYKVLADGRKVRYFKSNDEVVDI